MDFSPLVEQLRERTSQIARTLEGTSLAFCAGNRALLGAWLQISQAEAGLQVVAAVTTAAEALAVIEEHGLELLICSDRLEQGDGISLVETVKQRHPSTRTLLVVGEERTRRPLRQAWSSGCDGICAEAKVGQGSLLAAVQSVVAAGRFIDGALMARLQESGPGAPAAESAPSRRELEVLDLLQLGLSNREIAHRLYLSEQTVKSHVASLLQKLGVRDRGQAALIGLRRGLIDWRDP